MDITDRIRQCIVAVLNPDNDPNGTGFFITSDGYILTCYHVIKKYLSANKVDIRTAKGITLQAAFIADKSRPEKDIDFAILKVNDPGPFPCLPLGTEVDQNDPWCTLGFELAERYSGVPNDGTLKGYTPHSDNSNLRDIILKSDNPILGGLSGSPVFNKKTGRVVGVIKEELVDTQGHATSTETVFWVWPDLEKLNAQSELLVYPIDIWSKWLEWADRRCVNLIEKELNWVDRDPNLDLETLPVIEFWNEFINSPYWHEDLQSYLEHMNSHCSNPSVAMQIQNIINNVDWKENYETILHSIRKEIERKQKQLKNNKLENDKLNHLRNRLEDPRFGRCFLLMGSIGSGKTHFIASILNNKLDYNCLIFPLRPDQSGDIENAILENAKSATGITWQDLNEFFTYVKKLNEYLALGQKKQFRIVITVDDLQKWIALKEEFIDSLQNLIQEWTKWPTFWIITIHDTCYGDVSEKRIQTRFWERYSPRFEDFGENSDDQVVAESQKPCIEGWLYLDFFNSWKETGMELIKNSMTDADIRSLQSYPFEIDNRDLCNPLIAMLFIYLYEKNTQLIAIFNMNFIDFIKLFWDIRKEALCDITTSYSKLKEDSWIAKLKEQDFDQSVTLIAMNLSQTDDFISYQDLKRFMDCIVKSASSEEFPDNKLKNIDSVKKIFVVLEKGNMIECRDEKTTSFYQAFKTRKFKILFEMFWEYSLAEPLLIEYVIKEKDAEYPLIGLEKWFSRVKPEGTKRGVFQFLLLRLEEEFFKKELSAKLIEEIWHLGLNSKELPPEAVWFAGPKASKNIQKLLVMWGTDYEINQNSRIILFSFMYFLRNSSTDVNVISTSHRLKLLQRYFKNIEEGNLSGYYLNIARVLLDRTDNNDEILDYMQYFHGSEIMEITEDLADATFIKLEKNSKNIKDLLEIITRYIQKNGYQVQMEYEERKKSNLEPKKWRRYFYLEYILKAFTFYLSREMGAEAYNFLKENNWFKPNKLNINHKRVGLFMEQEANIALGQRYRIYNELDLAQFKLKRDLFLDLLEDLVKSTSEKDKLNAFHIIRHTVRTGIEGSSEADYIVADLFQPYLIEILLDLQSSASSSSKWLLSRFYPFFAVNISDLSSILNPVDTNSWCQKGIILSNLSKYEQASNCFNKAIEINPKYIKAWSNRGMVCDHLGKEDEAIKAYNKVLELFPQDAEDWNYTGIALTNLERYDEAIIAYDKAIDINPNYIDAWCNKGIALDDLDRYDDAILAYNKALELDPKHADTWYNKGNALYDLGNYDAAIHAYDRALKQNPRYADTWYNKGNALYDLGNYDAAIHAYDRALKQNPRYVHVWRDKGNALYDLGNYDAAINAFDKAIEIDPKDAITWNNKGWTLNNLGEYDEAIKAFDKATEIDPQYAEAWNNKGYALDGQGKYDEAIKAYDKAIEIDPKDAVTWNNKGLTLNNMGKYDDAIKVYDRAIEIDPKDAVIWNNKGIALKSLGRIPEANAAFANSRELGYID